jgi:DNA-binding GntR family transcriptional regulator
MRELILKKSQGHKINRISLSDQASQKMKSWILSLRVQPGERLIIDNLAEELGISRTPIREGLHRLVAEGLVQYDGKSYTITRFSRREVENLFEVRLALETLAAYQASERITPELLDQFWAWHAQCQEHQHDQDVEFLITHDMRFHQLIREAADNARLKDLLDNLHDQIWWVIRLIFSTKIAQYQELFLLREHLAILECINNHDAKGAARMMEKHIRRSERDILALFEA